MPGLPLQRREEEQRLTPEQFAAWKAAREQQQQEVGEQAGCLESYSVGKSEIDSVMQAAVARAAARQAEIEQGAPMTGDHTGPAESWAA